MIIQINQVERLKVRLQVMMFMGNFEEDIALLTPVSLYVIAVVALKGTTLIMQLFSRA